VGNKGIAIATIPGAVTGGSGRRTSSSGTGADRIARAIWIRSGGQVEWHRVEWAG